MSPPNSRLFLSASFALILAACSRQPDPALARTDADITRSLVGSWKVAGISSNGMETEKGTVCLMKDGTVTSEASIDRGNVHIFSFSYEGTWQVENRVLVETVTKSSISNRFLHVGCVTRDSILSVDSREVAYKTESGKVVTRERIP